MTLGEWIKNWKIDNLKINTGFLSTELTFNNADKSAAWEMYVELLTRISTQFLEPEEGDEQTALNSIYSIFNLTRGIVKKYGFECIGFTKIAMIILNQKIRPFTAKWHKLSLENAFNDKDMCLDFRNDLKSLQRELREYTRMLADIIGVEDLVDLHLTHNK